MQSRQALTAEQIEKNAETYLAQISKVVDLKNVEIVRNGDWFSRYDFAAMLRLLGQMTMQRMIERDDFTKRIKARHADLLARVPVPTNARTGFRRGACRRRAWRHRAALQFAGGRDLQRDAGQEPQICLTMPILRGLDGVKKMGKSVGNYIGVGESAYDQFAKTMSIPDDLMRNWFDMLTDRPTADVESLLAGHPMVAKKTLGRDVVGTYHGEAAEQEAQAEWERRFSARQDPTEIAVSDVASSELADGKIMPGKLLALLGFAKSNNEARQRITEGAMTVGPDKTKIEDPKTPIPVTDGLIVRLGSKKVAKVRIV